MQSKLVGIIGKLNNGLRVLSEVDSKVLKKIKEDNFKPNIQWDECMRGVAHSIYDVSTRVAKNIWHGFNNSVDNIKLSNENFTLDEREKAYDISIAVNDINSDFNQYGPNVSFNNKELKSLWMKRQTNNMLKIEGELTSKCSKYRDLKDRNTLILNSQGSPISNKQLPTTNYQRPNLHPRVSQGIREIGLVPVLFGSKTNTKDIATTLQIPSTGKPCRMASNSGLNNL